MYCVSSQPYNPEIIVWLALHRVRYQIVDCLFGTVVRSLDNAASPSSICVVSARSMQLAVPASDRMEYLSF